MLPDDYINCDISYTSFCADFQTLAKSDYDVDPPMSLPVGSIEIDVSNFKLKSSDAHTELGFQLISHSDVANRIFVEIRALRWGEQQLTATAEQYVRATTDTVGALLKTFNKVHGKRYRLTIVKPKMLPIPSNRTLDLFEKFCGSVSHSLSHPSDFERLYRLVDAVRQNLREETLDDLFKQRGFGRYERGTIVSLYMHLRKFKFTTKKR